MPSLNDLRDSGAIEQDIVKSMMLWKTDVEKNSIGLVINKNRRGSTGAVELNFKGEYMLYTELGVYDIKKQTKEKKGRIGGFIVLLEQLENKIEELQAKEKSETGFNSLSTLTMLEMIKIAKRQNKVIDKNGIKGVRNERMLEL